MGILKHRLQRPSEHDKREEFPGMAMLGYAAVRRGQLLVDWAEGRGGSLKLGEITMFPLCVPTIYNPL